MNFNSVAAAIFVFAFQNTIHAGILHTLASLEKPDNQSIIDRLKTGEYDILEIDENGETIMDIAIRTDNMELQNFLIESKMLTQAYERQAAADRSKKRKRSEIDDTQREKDDEEDVFEEEVLEEGVVDEEAIDPELTESPVGDEMDFEEVEAFDPFNLAPLFDLVQQPADEKRRFRTKKRQRLSFDL